MTVIVVARASSLFLRAAVGQSRRPAEVPAHRGNFVEAPAGACGFCIPRAVCLGVPFPGTLPLWVRCVSGRTSSCPSVPCWVCILASANTPL